MDKAVVTRGDLIERCRRMGYSLTPRTISNWIGHGLLPPLVARGNGRGRGKTYYWPDPIVVPQAMAASDFLGIKSRFVDARLNLWWAGFVVPLPMIRRGWLNQVLDEAERLGALPSDPYDRDEWVTRQVAKVADKQKGPSRAGAIALTQAVLSADFDIRDVEVSAAILGDLAALFPGATDAWRAKMFQQLLAFVHENFAVANRYELLSNASDETLIAAQRDWRLVVQLVSEGLRFVPGIGGGQPPPQWRAMWWRFIARLGEFAILVDMGLRNLGYGRRLDESVLIIADVATRVNVRRSLRQTMKQREITDELAAAAELAIDKLSLIWGQS